jgi:putative transposase
MERIFFVTVNLRHGVRDFQFDEYPIFLKILDTCRRRLGFSLCGYVLMPDHWHALIWPHGSLTISQAIHAIKKDSALRIHRHRETSGAFWQHQFWDRFVRHAREYSTRLEYMHFNPVRRGLVREPGDWPWSSHTNYSMGRDKLAAAPIAID